jgi:hypothetical protein
MCQYCNRIQSAIARHRIFWIGSRRSSGRISLSLQGPDIRYTKISKKTNNPYSKVIPIQSLHQAKQILLTKGMSSVNRSWHNTLPEGRNRPCNLKVIEAILNNFP